MLAKAKLNDVLVLSQKNRQPNDNPGAQLVISVRTGNDVLVQTLKSIRTAFVIGLDRKSVV